MDFVAVLRIAFRALARNKLRSALTMLGIIIGVGAVIAMVSVGQGAQHQVQQQIAAMGTNTLFVTAGTAHFHGFSMGSSSMKTLIPEDAAAIAKECPAVKAVAPGVFASSQVVYQNQNWGTRITGTTPRYFDIMMWPMKSGMVFTNEDVEAAADVAILGSTVVENLFGVDEDPVGKVIRVKNLPFRVIGVTQSKGQSGMGEDQDDRIFLPYVTVQKKLLGTTWLNFISVQAVSKDATFVAQQQITSLLRQRHRIRQDDDDDFSVRNMTEIADLADQAGQVLTMLLASIASVSLIVGGIGIMNIMLVSVTERTREIGIRMAIGATEGDVQGQFLIEAVVLSLFGGMIGIIFGVFSSSFISSVLRWPTFISPASIGLAVVFSIAVGVFFGFYPARKAARLDPIEALRYE